MYTVEKRTVRKKGKASIGWILGRGYVTERFTFKVEGVWCVMKSGKVFAEARGKAKAELIAGALNAE